MLGYVIAIGKRVIGYLLAYWSMPRSPGKPSDQRKSRRGQAGRR
jgi:hypothetical protein